MGGKYWSAAEEEAFWTDIVPRAVYGRERPTEASFGPYVARMREIGDPSRRNYNAVAMYEHWHLNAVQGTLSPNVGQHAFNYIRNDAARMRAQGVMPSVRSDETRGQPGNAAQVPRAQPPNTQGPSVQSNGRRTPDIPAFNFQPPNAQGSTQPPQEVQTQGQEDSDVVFISARHLYGEANQDETTTASKQDRFLSKLDASIASPNASRSLANTAKMPNWVVYYDDQTLAPGDAAPVLEERGGVWRFKDQTLETQHDKTGEKGKKLEEVIAPPSQRIPLPSAQPQRQPQQPLEPPVDDARERERRYREAQQQQMEMRLQEAARQDRERHEREWHQNEAERQRLMAEREALWNYGRQAANQPQMGWHPAPPQHGYSHGGQPQGGYQQLAPSQGGHPYAGYQPGGYHQGGFPEGGYQPPGSHNGQGSYYGSDPALYQMGPAPGQYNSGYSGYGPGPDARHGEEELRRQQEEEFRHWQREEDRRRQQRKQ